MDLKLFLVEIKTDMFINNVNYNLLLFLPLILMFSYMYLSTKLLGEFQQLLPIIGYNFFSNDHAHKVIDKILVWCPK